jgi:uncharacterized Zn finger protein
MGYDGYGFPPYVPVAERRRRAAKKLAQLRKKGHAPAPIAIEGREIARTFWGKAWCDHLESHADFESRLPRGKTYVRNGSVIDLRISEGQVRALVSGSEIYEVSVAIKRLAPARWKAVRGDCAGQIATVVELLSGQLSTAVMEKLCHRQKGLFPATRELELSCSCPDGAWLCKHLAAVLYGVGARLDHAPELLFTLRGVDGAELVASAGRSGALKTVAPSDGALGGAQLSEIFGIELEGGEPAAPVAAQKRRRQPTAPKPRTGRTDAKGKRPPAAGRGRRGARPSSA